MTYLSFFNENLIKDDRQGGKWCKDALGSIDKIEDRLRQINHYSFFFIQTFGNLEFTLGPEVLADFLGDINFDAVSANLNITNEQVLNNRFYRSIIKIIDGQSVGIVGFTDQRTNEIAIVGKELLK